MSRNILLSSVAAVAVTVLISAHPAKADLIQVGLASSTVSSGTITFEDSSTTGSMNWTPVNYGAFSTTGNSQDTLGIGLPAILYSQTIDVSSFGTGTIQIFVVASQQSSLKGLTNWTSSFTTNDSGSDSVTEQTYFAEGNESITTGQTVADLEGEFSLLQSKTLSGTEGMGPFGNSQTVTTPWSVLEVYTITASSTDEHFNDTIDLNATIPEPASLSLLGGGLVAFGAWRRRRNRKA